MLNIQGIHHIAIICSDYQKSKEFYTKVLGLKIAAEHFRSERNSWKLDLEVNGQYAIELFSFTSPPERVSNPEAAGLRHLAFQVADIQKSIEWLKQHNVHTEPIRVDQFTGKKFTFFSDPDKQPLELYEL
jgi:glyoxylase I family protein